MSVWPPELLPALTDEEKRWRSEEAKRAKRASDEIDEAIEREKKEIQLQKRRRPRKVLLLGQSGSGKSTMMKSFQYHFAPKAFNADAEAWRIVIYLNLVRSANFILDMLAKYGARLSSSGSINGNTTPIVVDELRHLRMRLSPLRQVEMILTDHLAADNSAKRVFDDDSSIWRQDKEFSFAVRGGSSWKSNATSPRQGSKAGELANARSVIEACRDDVAALWKDPAVPQCMKDNKITLEDHSEYFLDQVARIASGDYAPTPVDILRARLETIGIEEHHIFMETGEKVSFESELTDADLLEVDMGQEWIFYDIEGSRSYKAAWVPFFDDVTSIVFLCSMANFDHFMPDDPSKNCYADSFLLWRAVCENKLLTNATLCLFLNKTDLLISKLKSGIFFGEYVLDYKDKPNAYKEVTSHFKSNFSAVHQKYSPRQRHLSVYVTCAIDTKTMSTVLRRVKESILLASLKESSLLV